MNDIRSVRTYFVRILCVYLIKENMLQLCRVLNILWANKVARIFLPFSLNETSFVAKGFLLASLKRSLEGEPFQNTLKTIPPVVVCVFLTFSVH